MYEGDKSMDNHELKLINKQFYKYWKKVVREWKGYSIHERKLFHALNDLSNKIKAPINEIVIKVLLLDRESIFRDDYDEIVEAIKLNLSYEDIVLILDVSGYEKRDTDYFYLVDDRRMKLLNVCYATSCWSNEGMMLSFFDKLNILRGNYYQKKQEKYEVKSNQISLKYKLNAFKVDPANGERLNAYSSLLSKIILFIVVLSACLLLAWVIVKYNNPISSDSALNFCNTLLAATLPCLATIITTYMLIQHEYKVDYHKERMGSLPIFSLEHADKESLFKENGKKKDRLKKRIEKIFFDTVGLDIRDDEYDVYKLSNIGYGIGFNVRHDRGDEIFYFGDIVQENCCYIGIKKYPFKLNYVIEYTDIYGNKYIQVFDIERNDSVYNITTFSPELVLRTKRLRYQQ